MCTFLFFMQIIVYISLITLINFKNQLSGLTRVQWRLACDPRWISPLLLINVSNAARELFKRPNINQSLSVCCGGGGSGGSDGSKDIWTHQHGNFDRAKHYFLVCPTRRSNLLCCFVLVVKLYYLGGLSSVL